MTDPALPVTERAVDEFVTDYLESLGATIRKEGRRWTVSTPDESATELSLNDTVIHLTADSEEADDDAVPLAPGSDLFERLVDDATERAPLGSVSLTGDDVEFDTPDWVRGDAIEVTDQQFTPYYDRNALCVLFHVGIETVSEYQRDLLRAVAVDLADHEPRPKLAQTCLDLSERNGTSLAETGHTIASDEVAKAISACREIVENAIDPEVREVRKKATRAATVEIEEYRKYLRQQRDELEDETQRLADRVDELSATIDTASEREERLERLRKRKEFRNELADLRDELDEVRDSLEQDLPEKRAAIRDRHALTVRIQPVTATVITYERGDLDISVRDGSRSATLTSDYAVGVGTLNQPTCEQCGAILDAQNPIVLSDTMSIGRQCCDEVNHPPSL